MIRRRRQRNRKLWSPTSTASGWSESTLAETAWERSRSASTRWAVLGVVVGSVIGLVAFAPASWLARAVSSGTQQKLVLADARGTIWSGSAAVVLTGGPGSRDATALPGRLEWTLNWQGLEWLVQARHACCLNGTVKLRVRPGWSHVTTQLLPSAQGWIAQWPSAWLSGLGTPWNTLKLGGSVRLSTLGPLTLESAGGRLSMQGQAELDILSVSSRLTTLDQLGSYKLSAQGEARSGGSSQLKLQTTDGALQLNGEGLWSPSGLRFRGEATAAPGDEAALSNLLNIIGRRSGARSLISIG
jgi:general secretion pathway protein N